MSDEDPIPEEQRIFTLTEAERTLREIEPLLVEAVACRRKLGEAEEQVSQIASRIMLLGGMLVNTELTSRLRGERERLTSTIREALEGIESTGCVVKDLDTGLAGFSRAHRRTGSVFVLAARRRSHSFLASAGRRICRTQAAGFGRRAFWSARSVTLIINM